MIESNLLKSNFLGRDGFNWFIGQVPQKRFWGIQYNKDPDAWGNRIKVRIMGYHPPNRTELKDSDLPWAQVMLPTSTGSGKSGRAKPVRISPGDVVFGFFLDGDDAQQPIIMGVLGHSKYSVPKINKKNPAPFEPFTGYTDEVQSEEQQIPKNEVNDSTTDTQESPRNIDENTKNNIKNSTGRDVKSTSEGMGHCVANGNASPSKEIGISLKNAQKEAKLGGLKDKAKNISNYKKKIAGASNSLTNNMISSAVGGVTGAAKKGMDGLFTGVYGKTLAATQNPAAAFKAGQKAQEAMLGPVAAFQKKLPCVSEAITESLLPDITSMLTSFLDNVNNVTDCMIEQFNGAIFNSILGGLDKGLGAELGGMSKILGGFDMVNDLRGKADALLGASDAIKCVTGGTKDAGTDIWCMGKGPMGMAAVAGSQIANAANLAQSLQEAAGAPGGIVGNLLGDFDFLNPNVSSDGYGGNCGAGEPKDCKGVQVKVFGSDGEGTVAEPIIGAIVPDSVAQETGSLIGVKLTNPGEGYTVPPLVEITDNCNRGYGAQARAIIDYDPQSPTYQQVVDIVVVTPGENYPVIEDTATEYTVDHVAIISGGQEYAEDDIVTDNAGNEYVKFIDDNGSITLVVPPNPATQNVKPVDGIPSLKVETETGFGADLKPQLAPRPTYQGEIKQVIDCITPRDGIVGFVNGEPYYGPFHVHPTRGVKMVGAAHTTAPHAIIYDTPAESRGKNAVIGGVSSQFQTVAADGAVTYTPSETPTTTETAPMTDTTMGDGSVTYQDTTPTPPSTSSGSSSSGGGSSTPPPSSPPPSSGGGGGGYGY